MTAHIDVCQEPTITRPSLFACYFPPPPPTPQTDSPLKALLTVSTESASNRRTLWRGYRPGIRLVRWAFFRFFCSNQSDVLLFFVPTNQMSCYLLFQPIRCVVIFCSNQSDVDILYFRYQKKWEGGGGGVLITGESVSLRKNVLTSKIPEKEWNPRGITGLPVSIFVKPFQPGEERDCQSCSRSTQKWKMIPKNSWHPKGIIIALCLSMATCLHRGEMELSELSQIKQMSPKNGRYPKGIITALCLSASGKLPQLSKSTRNGRHDAFLHAVFKSDLWRKSQSKCLMCNWYRS